MVEDGAEVSDATCVPFDRIYAVGGLEPKVDVMQTLGSLEICPLYMDFGAILLSYAHSHRYIDHYIYIYIHKYIYIYIYIYIKYKKRTESPNPCQWEQLSPHVIS